MFSYNLGAAVHKPGVGDAAVSQLRLLTCSLQYNEAMQKRRTLVGFEDGYSVNATTQQLVLGMADL